MSTVSQDLKDDSTATVGHVVLHPSQNWKPQDYDTHWAPLLKQIYELYGGKEKLERLGILTFSEDGRPYFGRQMPDRYSWWFAMMIRRMLGVLLESLLIV